MAQLNERKCNDGDSDEEMENNVLDTVQQPVTPIINQDTSRGAIQQQELIQHQRQVLDDIEAEREEKEESKRWVNDLIHPNRTGPLPGPRPDLDATGDVQAVLPGPLKIMKLETFKKAVVKIRGFNDGGAEFVYGFTQERDLGFKVVKQETELLRATGHGNLIKKYKIMVLEDGVINQPLASLTIETCDPKRHLVRDIWKMLDWMGVKLGERYLLAVFDHHRKILLEMCKIGLGSNVVQLYDDWNSIGIEIPPSNQWNGTRTSLKEDKLREREVYYRGRHINEMDMCSDTRRSWVEKRDSPLKEKEYDDDM